jgi:hypothetical protein
MTGKLRFRRTGHRYKQIDTATAATDLGALTWGDFVTPKLYRNYGLGTVHAGVSPSNVRSGLRQGRRLLLPLSLHVPVL